MKENLYPNPISGQDAFNEIRDYMLGKDWYVVDPTNTDQVNAIALQEMKDTWDMYTGKKMKDKWNNLIDKLKFR